jgi:hypothetical protein
LNNIIMTTHENIFKLFDTTKIKYLFKYIPKILNYLVLYILPFYFRFMLLIYMLFIFFDILRL